MSHPYKQIKEVQSVGMVNEYLAVGWEYVEVFSRGNAHSYVLAWTKDGDPIDPTESRPKTAKAPIRVVR